MTSRVANGNDFLRLLLMPALAVGLAVGCAPAKGGGGNSGGSTGQSGGGNSGQTGGSKSGGTTSASGGNNNPSGGNNNPSGGNNNPSGGSNNPSGGNNNPSGGNNNPSGGNNNPSGGSTSPSGGNNNPSGGNNNPSGGNRSGGTTSPSGGNNNPSGGNNNPSGGNKSGGTTSATGGNNNPSGGTTTSSGGTNPSGGTTSSTGGSTVNPGTNPPGWWMTKDWNVSSVDWHGCVWTGVDSTLGAVSDTSILPQDFISGTPEGGPYHVSGTVYNDYNAVAMIGFNLNEAATGDSNQCKYNKAAALLPGPPAGTIPSSATGIAVGWSAAKAPPTSFRIQVQGVDGATNAAHRWCATITDPGGPSFVPFSSMSTACWSTTAPGTAYAKDAIDAVVFLVPGTVAQKAPFDFTINCFAPGTSKSDVPCGAASCGTTAGTIGSTTASLAASMQRVKISGTDCKQYIIQNNNWGNATGSTQIINYVGNSFTVQSTSGNGSSAPASFPSCYVGANGDLANGTYNTWADSGLPKQVSAIQSVQTSFGWSGGTGGKDFNATYDVWFASSSPTPGSYNDAISGFVMVWLHKPTNHQPIGSIVRTATIAGQTWNVWVGPRGTSATGTDGPNRPVVSYVAQSDVSSVNFDLNLFIKDAATNGIQSGWWLTDVFGGFEIWTGSDAAGVKCTGFTCVVK